MNHQEGPARPHLPIEGQTSPRELLTAAVLVAGLWLMCAGFRVLRVAGRRYPRLGRLDQAWTDLWMQ